MSKHIDEKAPTSNRVSALQTQQEDLMKFLRDCKKRSAQPDLESEANRWHHLYSDPATCPKFVPSTIEDLLRMTPDELALVRKGYAELHIQTQKLLHHIKSEHRKHDDALSHQDNIIHLDKFRG